MLALAMLPPIMAGCATPPGRGAPTRADQLIAAYEELAEGRFLTLADFETPETLKLCQIKDTSGKAGLALDPKRGRRETGGGALRFTAAGDDDGLAIGGGHDPDVYMKRDWRPYDLLLMSIHSPRAGVGVRVGLTGGFLDRERRIESPLTLDRGWNLLKFDLAELAERLFLDDVRRIELSASGIDRPVDLLVDDLILTAHRKTLMGDPEGAPGSLYVLEVGRRWRVGVTGGFEIGFQNGQIVEWFDPANDPTRLRNFVFGTVLGPAIVDRDDRPTEAGERTVQRTAMGDRVRSSQNLIEQSALRVVIECRLDGAAPPSDGNVPPLGETYLYAIYPSGHIYATASRRITTATQSRPPGGVCFSIASIGKANAVTCALSPEGEQDRRAVWAIVSAETGGASALIALPGGGAEGAIEAWYDREGDRLNLLARPDRRLSAVQQWFSAMRLARRSDRSAEDVEAEAAAMIHPPAPRVEVGRLGTPHSDQPASGHEPTNGCIPLVPERGYLRFVLDEAWPAGMMPTYRIEQSENREAAIYVDHLIHDRIARDASGRLLVQLPAGDSGTRVEILLRAGESAAPPEFDTR
jgi:hypothetical protein